MQSQQNVIRHSHRGPMRRNTQRLPWLAGLFCASLTGCILEERSGIDAPNPPSPPDLRTLPDLRADLLPSQDLAAPCGSDGILFNGKCIYDFYQPDATSCAGKSITLYNQGSQFKQICDCACDRSTLKATLYHGAGIACGMTPVKIISPSTCDQSISLTGPWFRSVITDGSCQDPKLSRTSWKLEENTGASVTYCLLSAEAHRTASQECVIIDGSSMQCPSSYRFKGLFGFLPQNALLINCSCCTSPDDYPAQPINVYSSSDCSGIPFTPISVCANSSMAVGSAKWSKFHCPENYSKMLETPAQTVVATQTVCCKQ